MCGSVCQETSSEKLFLHPVGTGCLVQVVDDVGASLDHAYVVEDGTIYEKEPDPEQLISLRLFTPTDNALKAIFGQYNVPLLGGTSGIEGWSSISTFQRCPYAWARTYLPELFTWGPLTEFDYQDAFGLAVGSVAHALLAVYYSQKIDTSYPLSPELLRAGLDKLSVDPAIVAEAWRLFSAYRIFYKFETLKPVKVEALYIDPASKRSCRTDSLVIETADDRGHPPGLYVMDHKTAQRFDDTTLTGWHNDGGIIQQADIFASTWEQQPEYQKYGPLQGVIVNIIGKQKEAPQFFRAFVHPSHFQVEQHRAEAPVWQAQRNLCIATGIFPRARNGCITRYGKCSHWEHCVTGE